MERTTDRRQTPRFRVDDQIGAVDQQAGQPLAMVDISLGGFLATSPVPIGIGAVRQIEFTCRDDDWSTALRARVAYNHRRAPVTADGQVIYLIGFAFLDIGQRDVDHAIDVLIARATGILIFK
jgi:hypothetical protein